MYPARNSVEIAQARRPFALLHFLLRQEETKMENNKDTAAYQDMIRFNEQWFAATMEYWAAWSYPAIYFAKYL